MRKIYCKNCGKELVEVCDTFMGSEGIWMHKEECSCDEPVPNWGI